MSTPRTAVIAATVITVITVIAGVGVVAACGGSTSSSSASGAPATGDGGGTSGSTCSDLAASAAKDVGAVIDAHRSCTQASDCTSVELSASCFDSCTRAMRKDAADALKAAQDKANQNQCVQFSSQGCKVNIPPCEPPTAPTCQSGVCS
jgi:hypothetical protein